jgi:hypothetical protein
MEQEQSQLDSVLGALNFDEIAGGASDTAAESDLEAAAPSDEQAVAPSESEDPTDSAEESPDPAQAAAPTPSTAPESPKPTIDFDSDDNPYKAEAAEARKMRETLERAYTQWQQQQQEQTRQAKQAEIAERIARISDEYSPEQAKREASRIVAEVEAEFRQQTQPVIQNYEGQLQEREQVAENIARQLAAFYRTVERRMPAEQFKALQAEVEYALKFDSPDAMEAHFGHLDAATKSQRDQIAALTKQVEELKLAQKAQKRIASGADSAGTGVGRPAAGSARTRTDETVDAAFAAMGLGD